MTPPVGSLRTFIEGLPAHGGALAVLQFMEDRTEEWSFLELAEHAERLSRGLRSRGLRPGDPVALLAANSPRWIVTALAVVHAGGVLVPIDVQLGKRDLSHVLADSGSDWLVTTVEQRERLEALGIAMLSRTVFLDVEDGETAWPSFLAERGEDALPPIDPSETAVLLYTSGTTGTPKGVPLSHANIAHQLDVMAEVRLIGPGDRLLQPLPLHHVYPLVIGTFTPLALGVPVVLPHALTGPELLRAIRDAQVTAIAGVPRLYGSLYAGIESRLAGTRGLAGAVVRAQLGASSWLRRTCGVRAGKWLLRPLHKRLGPRLRVFASGGAPLDPELAWKLEALGFELAIGYGLTETSPLLTLDPPGKARIGTVGRPIRGVEIRIAPREVADDEDGEAPGAQGGQEIGEVLARGPNVFSGYRNLQEETRKVFTADGWFRTGDLGALDRDGYLRLFGRASTLIVTEAGKNVQPEDVEEAYQESPLIREIAVLQRGRELAGLVVPDLSELRRRGEKDVEAAIRGTVAECSKRLPTYKRISGFAVTRDPLPRTRLGKLRRHLLKERYDVARAEGVRPRPAVPVEELPDEDRSLLASPAAEKVWKWLSERYAERAPGLDSSLSLDLGIDSLEWLYLTIGIGERTGVELDEGTIARIDTVRDLLGEVAERAGAAHEKVTGISPVEAPERVLGEKAKKWVEDLAPWQAFLSRVMFAINRWILRGAFRLRVQGVENVPQEGPFILVPNHASYLDSPAIAAALDSRRIARTYWAGWTGVAFKTAPRRFLSRLTRVVPVDAERSVVSSLAFGALVLERGKSLVWFPEGGRSRSGELERFKPGIGMLLERFDVPVVPVYLEGTYAALPPHRRLPRPHAVTLVFGKPLRADDLPREGSGAERHERVASALREEVARLRERARAVPERV